MMRGKRHWYNNINWDMPIHNTKYWYKNLGSGSKRRLKHIANIIGAITCILLLALFVVLQINEIIATDLETQRVQKLEQIRLEKQAIEKEKQLKVLAQETEKRSIKEWNEYQRLHTSQLEENKLYEKMAKEKYPIGTYIRVKEDGKEWIGKIKTIHGAEITTTDNWHCYWGDDIKYSEVKEYNKFIKQNSKG